MPAFLWTNSRLADISGDLATIKASHIDVLYATQMGQVVCPGRPHPATDAEMLAYLDALDAAGLQAMLDVMGFGKYVVSGRPNKVLGPGYTSNIIPTMTSATAPSGVASSSGNFAFRPEWKAFDHVNPIDAGGNTGWMAPAGTTGYLQYQFPAAHIITQYAVTSRNEGATSRVPKSWTLKGSNNGSTWVTLDTRTNITDWATSPNLRKVFTFANTTAYTYYRLNITASNDAAYVGVGELEMMEWNSLDELAALTAYVDKWKTHPAVWGWYADDEGGTEYPIAARQQVYDTIKAAHPAGQVVETHWLIGGGYSPDVHDVFAMDAGPPTSSYVYYYDDHPPYGCVDLDNGTVSLPDNEWSVLAAFKTHLDTLRAQLVAAGETQYMLCMQAFGQGWAVAPAQVYFAMPPPGGISKMWAVAQQAGWDAYGVGWFLWHSDDATTLPAEQLVGIGDDAVASEHAPQRSEVAAIAKTFTSAPTAVAASTLPTYCVMVAGEDVTELVDIDTLHRSMSERGEASATIDIPVASENEVPVNGLARDADVDIYVDGGREWLGHVVAVHKPKPQDLTWTLDCAGGWDTLHHCAPYCKGFVETRYDAVTEYPPSLYAPVSGGAFKVMTALDVNTDGQVQFTLPRGSKVKLNQARFAYLWPLDGMDPGLVIERVTGTLVCGGSNNLALSIEAAEEGPFDAVADTAVVASALSGAAYSTTFDVTDFTPLAAPTHLRLWASVTADVAETSGEEFVQLFDLRIYIDRTTAPRVDEIVAAIDAEVRPDVPPSTIEAIGSPLTAFMLDPFMTPAEGIAVALTKAAVPPLCGVIQNQLVIKNRPAAPLDATRLWTVSEQLTPGLEWGVEVDEEQSVDYVGVSYAVIGDATIPDGTPRIAYYPSAPPNAAARTALIDGGDLTAAEAAFYAQQGYYYLHNLASGPVTIPYVVQDANGNERPADVIRAWDWVQNVGSLDADTAGPFLVSEVEHQGHIATLTIGAAEAYAYNGPERMPTKGRYVGAYRTRKRTKQRVSFETYWHWKYRAYYKKHKKYPGMPKKHAKYGTTHGWKWIEHEGRYT